MLAHVSRTYRVSMDGLFERISLDFVLREPEINLLTC